ncbi:MAG: hypothetical protein L0271_17470 [Gemmatimonadetes bacterium]|nr:hypothetical protein [Gemmatimonadota bacterium]
MRTRSNQTVARIALALTLAIGFAACDSPISERIIAIQDPGSARVFLFIDTNLNGQFNINVDSLARNILVSLRMKGALQDASATRTDSVGFASFSVPPGRYRTIVASTALGDSLQVMSGGDEFTIAANDTIQVGVSMTYTILDVSRARTAPIGRRFWLAGIASTMPAIFGDSTMHVQDSTMAIRATRMRPVVILPGDSVYLFGARSSRDGQPAFDVQSFQSRQLQTGPPTPDLLSTAVAATADAGRRDARLVMLRDAVIGDTATVAAGRLLRVDDGTGTVAVILSSTLNFTPLTQYAIGVKVDVTGVLVPDPLDFARWQVKPRGRLDVVIKP